MTSSHNSSGGLPSSNRAFDLTTRASVKSTISNAVGDATSECGSHTSTTLYEQESFDTYKLKVLQLCKDIGYGEASIERMKGGSFNRVFGLRVSLAPLRNYVLRVPRWAMDDEESVIIRDQAAVLVYVARYSFLRVPPVLAYDSTKDNALASQYVLQGRLPGRELQEVYYGLPLSEKLKITSLVADLLLKIESITLEKPGRLIGTRPAARASQERLIELNDIDIAGYRSEGLEDMAGLEKQPLTSLIIKLLEVRKQAADGWGGDD